TIARGVWHTWKTLQFPSKNPVTGTLKQPQDRDVLLHPMRGIAHEAPAFRQSRSAPAFVSRIEFLKLPGSAHLLNHHVEPHNGGTRPGDRNIVRRQRRAQGGLLIALGRRWPLGPEPGQRPDGPLWPRAGRFGVDPPSSRDGAGDLA